MKFCLNLVNLWEIMGCMSYKVKGAIVHGVFENVTPDLDRSPATSLVVIRPFDLHLSNINEYA